MLMLVPTLRVGTPVRTLCVPAPAQTNLPGIRPSSPWDAERPDCMTTRSVVTSSENVPGAQNYSWLAKPILIECLFHRVEKLDERHFGTRQMLFRVVKGVRMSANVGVVRTKDSPSIFNEGESALARVCVIKHVDEGRSDKGDTNLDNDIVQHLDIV